MKPALFLLVGLLAASGGATCYMPPSTPPPGATPTDLDMGAIQSVSKLALDLTDHQFGLLSERRLKSRNGDSTRPIEIHEVASTAYLIQFDEQAQKQTVALPGTTNPDNNEFNMRTELEFDGNIGGRIHAGYRDLSLQIRADLLPNLRPGWAVTLVGFSQGGAVAALLPLWLGQDGFTIESVITLGQPKVTDGSLAGRLALLPLIRLIAADDIIPSYPRVEGYAHFGRAIDLLDGPYIVSLSPGDPGYDDPRDLPSALPDLLGLDHGTYDARLQSKVNVTVYELPLDEAAALRP
jgi:hypothetical protein